MGKTENKKSREPLRGRVKHGDEIRGEDGRLLCRWCSQAVPSKRRTFCSNECVHEHKMRSNIDYMREQVLARDRGICETCQRDCILLFHTVKNRAEREGSLAAINSLLALGYDEFRATRALNDDGSLWDAAHRIPVTWGGGGCGIEGMKTLCVPCHKSETKLQSKLASDGIVNSNQPTLWGDSILELGKESSPEIEKR